MNINVFIIQRLASKEQTKSLFFTFLLLFRPIRGICGLTREVIVALTTIFVLYIVNMLLL